MNEQVKNNIMEYKQKYLQKLTDAQVPEKLEKQELELRVLLQNMQSQHLKHLRLLQDGLKLLQNGRTVIIYGQEQRLYIIILLL